MTIYLLLATIVMFACVMLNKISSKLGIPMLFAFILLGMFFGSDGVVKIQFNNYQFAEQICTIALIFIIFYGGFGTRWNAAKPAAVKSVLLSTVGVIMTCGLTGLFCHYVLSINLLESFLIGAVISSTDAASVFSVLRSKHLNLKDNTASLLEVESGSNDPCAYMLTIIIIQCMGGSADGGAIAYSVFSQIAYGLMGGIIIAFAGTWCLKKLHFASEGFDTIFVVAVALLAYSAPAAIGGNGYLGAYITGIIMGNSDIRNKNTLVPFFDGMTGLMQMLIFFLLGLLSFPSRMLSVAFPALCIALFLTFVARPVTVAVLLAPFKSSLNQITLVSWAGLRGAASIVFAIMALTSGKAENDIFHMVFVIVMFSILIQGSLMSVVSKKLNMIDDSDDVMKTFSDYSDEVPVQFIQFDVTAEHPWAGKFIKNIILPPDTLLVMLERQAIREEVKEVGRDKMHIHTPETYTERIIPNGKTMLLPGDRLILSAVTAENVKGIRFSEKRVKEGDAACGRTVSEVSKNDSSLIIMIQRGDDIVIPNGSTEIEAGDVLVINYSI